MKKLLIVILVLSFVVISPVFALDANSIRDFNWYGFGSKIIEIFIANIPTLIVILTFLANLKKGNLEVPNLLTQTKTEVVNSNVECMKPILTRMETLENSIVEKNKKEKELEETVKVLANQNEKLLTNIKILVSADSDLVKSGKATKIIEVMSDEKLQVKE